MGHNRAGDNRKKRLKRRHKEEARLKLRNKTYFLKDTNLTYWLSKDVWLSINDFWGLKHVQD